KHHSGPLAAIIEQHFDSSSLELVMQTIGARAHRLTAFVTDRSNRYCEGSKRYGPDDSAFVVVLFNRRRPHAGHANPIAAHFHDLRLAIGIEESRPHGL